MKTVLERAREEAFVGREQAAGYLAQVKACIAEGYNDEEDVPFAAAALEEAQATLDAIDAAIAAETPAKEPKRLRIPFVADTSGIKQTPESALEDHINIELDIERRSITVNGDALDVVRVVKFLLSEEACLATGGFVTGTAPFGVVGEHPRETIMSTTQTEELRVKAAETLKSGMESAKVVADEVDEAAVWSNHRRVWSLFGVPDSDNDFPLPGHRRFDLGDWVEVNVLHGGDVHCAVGQVVEITLRKGQPSFFRIRFPNGFLFEHYLFLAENMSHARQEAIVK